MQENGFSGQPVNGFHRNPHQRRPGRPKKWTDRAHALLALLYLTAWRQWPDERSRKNRDRDFPNAEGSRDIVTELTGIQPDTLTNRLGKAREKGLFARELTVRRGWPAGRRAKGGGYMTDAAWSALGEPPADWLKDIGPKWISPDFEWFATTKDAVRALHILRAELLVELGDEKMLRDLLTIESGPELVRKLVRQGKWPYS